MAENERMREEAGDGDSKREIQRGEEMSWERWWKRERDRERRDFSDDKYAFILK